MNNENAKVFDEKQAIVETRKAIASLKRAETTSRKALAELSRKITKLCDLNHDKEFVLASQTVTACSTTNRQTVVWFFELLFPIKWHEANKQFAPAKIKEKAKEKKAADRADFLADERATIWTLADDHGLQVKAKPDFSANEKIKRIVDQVEKAKDGNLKGYENVSLVVDAETMASLLEATGVELRDVLKAIRPPADPNVQDSVKKSA